MAIFGTKIVEFAEVKPDGSLPLEADWEELCKTYRDSVEVVDDDPDITEEYSDQKTDPIEIFVEPGKTNGKFSAYEYEPEILQTLMGGTVLDGVWTEGDNMGKDIALRFKTDSGHIIAWPVVKLFAKKNLKLVKKNVSLIDVTFTPKSKVRISKSV
jgi:hypothetical protein